MKSIQWQGSENHLGTPRHSKCIAKEAMCCSYDCDRVENLTGLFSFVFSFEQAPDSFGLLPITYSRHLLLDNGFAEVWQQQSVGNMSVFLKTLRERLIARFVNNWESAIQTSKRFEFNALFKRTFILEKYVDYKQLRCFKILYVQFRFGISPIRTHRLRYRSGVTPNQLLCPVCKSGNEDENHVLFVCAAYEALRNDFSVFQTFRGDVIGIMTADDEGSVCELSRFLYKAFKKRDSDTKDQNEV